MIVNFQKAIDLLHANQPVAIPTETVYGLAANAFSDDAVGKIYAYKQRPRFNPLIIHVAEIEVITWAAISPFALQLMQEFWLKRQASISFVLPLKTNHPISLLALAGLDTVAMRRPNHKIAIDLLSQLNFPLAAPSANKSNHISPTTANLVESSLGEMVPVIDGGSCQIGLESTVVSLVNDNIEILRLGSVTQSELAEFGNVKIVSHTDAIKAPGMLKRHYAPNHPLYLNITKKIDDMFLIGFGKIQGDLNLSENADLNQAARNLFAYLNMADQQTSGTIGIAPIPNFELGEAINDRLCRAAEKN